MEKKEIKKHVIHYIWLKKWRNIKEKGFSFDNKYQINFDYKERKLSVTKNKNYVDNFYKVDDDSGNILEINAVVGENGIGKTSLIKGVFNVMNMPKKKDGYLIIFSCYKGDKEELFCFSNIKNLKLPSSDIKRSEELPIEACHISMAMQHDDFYSSIQNDYSTGSIIHNYGSYQGENSIWRYFQTEYEWQLNLIDYLIENNINETPFNIPKYGIFEFNKYEDDYDNDLELNRLTDEAVEEIQKITKQSKEYFPKISQYVLISFFECIKDLVDNAISEAMGAYVIDISEVLFENGFQNDFLTILAKLYEKSKEIACDPIDYIMDKDSLDYIKEDIILNDDMISEILYFLSHNNKISDTIDWESAYQMSKSKFSGLNDQLIKKYRNVQTHHIALLKSYCLSTLWKTDFPDEINHMVIAIKIIRTSYYYYGEKTAADFLRDYNKLFEKKYEYPFRIVFELSAGELTFLSAFARILRIGKNANRNEKSYLLLLDEAELSLHPRWQQEYINTLVNLVPKFFHDKSVQVMIATHSPIMLSDIPKQNILYLTNNEYNISESFCANIFQLFRFSFFLDESAIGSFAERKLKSLISKINSISKTDENKLEDTIKQIKKEINTIGDRVLHQRIQERFDEELSEIVHKSPDNEIIILERELQKIQKRINELKNKENGDE